MRPMRKLKKFIDKLAITWASDQKDLYQPRDVDFEVDFEGRLVLRDVYDFMLFSLIPV